MKILIFFLGLIILIPSYAIDWADINGCYKTIQFNDEFLENSRDNYSVINLNENPLFVIGPDQGEYLVHSVVLFKGMDRDYHYQDIFFEDGATSKLYGELINTFKSFVRYRFDPDKVMSLSNEIRIKRLDENSIDIVVYYNLKHKSDSLIESGHFVLSRVHCYDDEETERVLTKGLKLPVEFKL
jgi:hypothetical protein